MTNALMSNRWVMSERPDGSVSARHFRREAVPVPIPTREQTVVRNVLVSVAPHARAVMQGDTYRLQLRAGELIPSSIVGEVVAAGSAGPAVGTLVAGFSGWEEYSVVPSSSLRAVTMPVPLPNYLSVLGLNGLTAYFGITMVGAVTVGQTVVLSGAAGGVGHIAGQVARMLGARVIGIVSSDHKADVLQARLGFDAVVNRTSTTFDEDLRTAAPDGVDVYFDNVAGPLLRRVLHQMNKQGRVVSSGATATYDVRDRVDDGGNGIIVPMIARSLRLEGFLVADFAEHWPAATAVLHEWVTSGDLIVLQAVHEGLETAPTALLDLFTGVNVGQTMVRLRPDPPFTVD
jgi:NADPH-dependent curcumin reductase CurA